MSKLRIQCTKPNAPPSPPGYPTINGVPADMTCVRLFLVATDGAETEIDAPIKSIMWICVADNEPARAVVVFDGAEVDIVGEVAS